jgi:hypothetical protein
MGLPPISGTQINIPYSLKGLFMESIKKDLRQEALKLKAEQAQPQQEHLVVNPNREDSLRCKREKVWFEHHSRFVITHTPQSCLNKPGNLDPRRTRARFDGFPSAKKNAKNFAQERQTNNECM